MEEKVIIWTTIVCVIVVVLCIKTIQELRKSQKTNILSIATDEEMFYCPGDIKGEIDDDI